MDPPSTALINNNNNTNTNTMPFHLPKIWQPSVEISRASLGSSFDRFIQPGSNREHVGPTLRKRRDNNKDEDDEADDDELTSKGVCDDMSDCDGKRLKTSVSGDDNGNIKVDGEENSEKEMEQKTKKPSADPPKDYIHVRARRGQATDSHSLAERARREKISERMRILQELVPGCNKVIGKALVLDEIINYIQSLQRQVEFLSMKLEAVNSEISPGIEAFPVKDFGPQAFDTSGVVYGSQSIPREYGRDLPPEWLHMQIGSGFDRQS